LTTSEVAAALGQAIALRIGEPRYNLWFGKNTKFSWEADRLLVGVPNHFYQEWLQQTFAGDVRAAATEVLGRPVHVRFAIDAELFQQFRQDQAETASQGRHESKTGTDCPRGAAAMEGEPARPTRETARRTRRWRRLGDFVVGPCNRVAHASAVSLVEAAELAPSPLVLHGTVGTGKTHLLEGIYLGLRRRHPHWRVCYVTSEDFTNRFVQAMRAGKLGAFRKQFRGADALLVDDLHFLATKRATQEEFLHTFNELHTEGRPVAVTCDCHPRLTEAFTPELTDRLLGGAVWGLAPPEVATRLAILRARATAESPTVPEEVLCHLADQLRGNVRELEGALHSLRHYAQVTGRPIDLEAARQALGELLRHAIRPVQLPDVDRAVCLALRLEPGSLQDRQRAWAISHPRMLAMYLARKHTAAAYSEIGRYFGGRNHSTAVAAEKKIREGLQSDGELHLGGQRLRLVDAVERVEHLLRH
jgi:chromosomal replication initiator protein